MERINPKKKVDRKRFVRYKEGTELYSMCQSKFEDMARDTMKNKRKIIENIIRAF